jgi:hypothetical protein
MTNSIPFTLPSKTKRRAMEQLSFFTQDALPAAAVEPERAELHGLIDTLPIEQIREMLELCKKTGRET